METMFQERLLREYTATGETTVYWVSVPGVADSAASGVEDGGLRITSEEMWAIFAPAVGAERDGLHVSVCYPRLCGSCISCF